MSSYAERLGEFNRAVSATNDHVATLKQALQNKELVENPAKLGTEIAGSVLGTTSGFINLRNKLSGDSEMRRTANAFFNRLGNLGRAQADTSQGIGDALQKGLGAISDAQKNMARSVGDVGNQLLQNTKSAAQSVGSQVADTGKTATNAVQNIRSGANQAPPQLGPSQDELGKVDGGVSGDIQAITNSKEANALNAALNRKAVATLGDDDFQTLNQVAPETLKDAINGANQAEEAGDAVNQLALQKQALSIKNNIYNHAIANKVAGRAPAMGYDDDGNGIYQVSKGAPNTGTSGQAATGASDSASGGASTGANASSTVATDAGATPSSALPHGGSANVGSASDLNPVAGLADDTTTAGAAAPAADAGASIAQRAQNLKLTLGQVPNQAGTGTVQGLTTAPTSQSAAGQAHIVSQAQGADVAQHSTAQAPGSQVQADANAQTAGAKASAQQGAQDAQSAMNQAGSDASQAARKGASAAANTADDMGNGIKSALGVEGTLDELAPEAGPLGPILEAGSLLATLGTSIASLFEKPKEKSTDPGPAPQTLSVGANLKGDASGSVGAF